MLCGLKLIRQNDKITLATIVKDIKRLIISQGRANDLLACVAGKNKQAKHVQKQLNWTLGAGVRSKILTSILTPSILRSPTPTPSKTSDYLRLRLRLCNQGWLHGVGGGPQMFLTELVKS